MSIVRNENGSYNLVDNEFNWPIANGTYNQMLLLKAKIDGINQDA